MSSSRGKHFEQVVREGFERVQGVSIDRVPDQTSGYKGSTNICDFVVYKYPRLYYIECKSIIGKTFPLSNLRPNQYDGLVRKSDIKGVCAGVLIWWVTYGVTRYVPIEAIEAMRKCGKKSISYDWDYSYGYRLPKIEGSKQRVYFRYDMNSFFNNVKG